MRSLVVLAFGNLKRGDEMKKNGYKTAVLAVDLMKNHTMAGGSNYYPTAGEMMPRVAESIDRMRDAGALIIYIWTKKNFSSGLTGAGPAVNQELLDATLSVSDIARLLGIHRNSVYNMVNKRHLFATVKANDKIRIYKDSFEAWYKSQKRHTIVTG